MTWRLDLPWLQRPPADFRQQLKNIKNQNEIQAKALIDLTAYALDLNQLHSLAQLIGTTSNEQSGCFADLTPLRLGIISNGTTKLLAPCLVSTGLRYGFHVSVIEGSFDQSLQEAIDYNSIIHASQIDVVLVALDHRGILGLREEFEPDENAAVQQSIEFIKSIREGLMQKSIRIVFQTVPLPPEAFFGNADFQIPGSRRRRIDLFNQRLAEITAEWGDILFDVANLATSVGLDRWFDEPKWHVGKLSFSLDIIPLYADYCLHLLAVAFGKCLRKCLVLDLDNTLWGGIIGDDGLSGIILGQGSAQGEAYLAVQKMALTLRRRGIILAVCSKNDDEIARLPFRKHPDMLLQEEHITVFLSNWRDKATNMVAIAEALNIGIDSLVFLDDNPAERKQVRDALPMIGVPELPEDPALFPRTLLAGGYFETMSFTQNDSLRAEQYQANALRALDTAKHRNLDDYLQSLEMVISFAPFDVINRARIAQLISRSNQFNLTTHRYSEMQVASLENAAESFTLQIRLADRFGDNGMISVVICHRHGDVWEIDTWLMSCRVLNRRVEEAVLDYLVIQARYHGAIKLVGHYYPTERNSLVKDHYLKLGFTFIQPIENGEKWELQLAGYELKCPPLKIRDLAEVVV